MPLYQYRCQICRNEFEKLVKMDARDKVRCPDCFGECQRMMSVVNWSFGWVLSDRSLNEKWGPRDEFVRNI